MTHNLRAIHNTLDTTISRDDYAGWDPFDGLNSKLFQATPLKHSRLARLAWLQAFKRSPINLRPLTLTPKVHNAKALALMTRSYCISGELDKARHCLDWLLRLRSDTSQWGDAAWGYPFDWQARAFFVPAGTPNVICTAYAVLALEAAQKAGILEDATELIRVAAKFVTTHLLRADHIAYIPTSDACVHNASLWGATICAIAAGKTGDDTLRNTAQHVIQTTLNAQGSQGEWPYGTLPHHGFIDSFHTGYNLEALHRSNAILQDASIADAITKGMSYYIEQFVDEAGNVAYYHTTPTPYDPHAAAQAILTLALITPDNKALAQKIMDACITRMWDERGHFHYQHGKHVKNKLCYLRWTQSWMHLALSVVVK